MNHHGCLPELHQPVRHPQMPCRGCSVHPSNHVTAAPWILWVMYVTPPPLPSPVSLLCSINTPSPSPSPCHIPCHIPCHTPSLSHSLLPHTLTSPHPLTLPPILSHPKLSHPPSHPLSPLPSPPTPRHRPHGIDHLVGLLPLRIGPHRGVHRQWH